MNDIAESAGELFNKGYNCAQSVFGAFAEECGVDFETAILISSSFGGGIAQLRGPCGAFTGMCMAMGAKYGYSDPTDKAAKSEFYSCLREMEKEFRKPRGTILCGELLAQAGQVGGKDALCGGLVRHAAEITVKYMANLEDLKS